MPTTEAKVPDIGDFKDVEVIEVHVKPGDTPGGRGPDDHARIGQGEHGGAGTRGRHGQGGQGQGRAIGSPRAI